MAKKLPIKIQWYGFDLENGKAKPPKIAETDAEKIEGLSLGELYICAADKSPALFFRTDADRVVAVGGSDLEELKKFFLSRVEADKAEGLIQFMAGLDSNDLAVFNNGAIFRSNLTTSELRTFASDALIEVGEDLIMEMDENGITEIGIKSFGGTLGGLENVDESFDTVPNDTYSLQKRDGIFYPVKGGGGGAQYVVRLLNNLDSLNIYAVKNEPAYADFRFESQFREDSGLVDTKERGNMQISVRVGTGAYKEVLSQYIQSGVNTRIDISKYLTSNNMNVLIKVTGEISEKTAPTLTYNVQLTSLSLSANNFQWWNSFEVNPVIPMNIGGSINKVLHVDVTGSGYSKSYDVNLGTTTYLETAYNYSMPHPSKTGVFNVSFYVKSTDGIIKTAPVSFNIVTILSGATEKLMAINNVLSRAINWTENALFDFTMYDGGRSTTSAKFEISKEGTVVYSSEDDKITTSAKQTLSVPLSIETFDNSDFQISSKVLSGTAVLSALTFNVDNSLGFSPEAGAVLYVNPRARNNSQANYKSIVNEVDGSTISAVWSNLNWGNDGWISDNGNSVLRLFAGSSVRINYKPFYIESARTGKTVEIDFKVNNVADYEKDILTIASDAAQFVGLKIFPDNIIVHSQALTNDAFQSNNFKDGARIRMTLVVMPDAYSNQGFNLCIIYINGVKNREFNYQNNDYFQQSGDIVIGSQTSDTDTYGIRVYDSALTSQGVYRNYVNWLDTNTEKAKVQSENDLLDVAGSEISYEKVKDKLNTFVFDNTFPSKANPNRYMGSLRVSFANRPELNAFLATVEARGQGTSSSFYWWWNQQWRLSGSTIVTYANGTTTTGLWLMMPGIPTMGRITAKKNFASSMQSHKMGSVNSITDLFKAMGYTNEGIQAKPESRITVSQEPFVGFEKSTNEQGEDVYTFMGIYTLGADKGDANTFNYDKKAFPGLLAIEGSDNAPLCALFRVPWTAERMIFDAESTEWMYNGVKSWSLGAGDEKNISKWIPAYNFTYSCSNRLKPFNGTLAEMNAQADTLRNEPNDFWVAKSGDVNQYNVYYYEVAEGKFIPSDIGSGIINLNTQLVDKGYGLSASDLVGKTPEQLNALFINARIQKFRKEVGTYFDINDAIFHRNWVEFNAGTDQRAKNTYPYTFGGKFRWRMDDTDTIFDTDNQGQPKKPYFVEVGDKYANGAPVWNGETSNFWNLIDLAFPEEIITNMRLMMSKMESLGGLNVGDTFGKMYAYFEKYYFDKAQKYFPINIYNADAKFTYETSKLAYIDGRYTNDTDPITQSLGDHYSAEQRWVSRRIIYMMSKYSYGIFAASGGDSITVRAAGNQIQYDITPAIDLYPGIASGTSIIRGARTKAGNVCKIVVDLAGTGDQQNTIQGASYLQDIGDWYNKNVTGSMIVQGKMLREIRLGSKTQPITISISSLTISNCPSLQKLVLSNISTLLGTLNISSCFNIKELYAGGTSLSQIVTPAGGGLEYIEYSSRNQYINLKNFPLLKKSGIIIETSKDKVTDFLITECPLLNPLEILEEVYNTKSGALKRIRCIGFDSAGTPDTLLMMLDFASGGYSGLDANGVATTGMPIFEGKLTVYTIGANQLEILNKAFPSLEIKYTVLVPTPTTTFSFSSNAGKSLVNTVFTCSKPFTKVSNTSFSVEAPDETILEVGFKADNHIDFSANYTVLGTRTQPYQVTYIPLRTVRVRVYGTSVYPKGAIVIMNGIEYATDDTGRIYLRSNEAVSGTAELFGYSKESFSFGAITNDTENTVDLYPSQDVKFTVKFGSTLIENAVVKVNGIEKPTNVYGEVVISLPKGAYDYTVEHPDYRVYSGKVTVASSPVNINVLLVAFSYVAFQVNDEKGFAIPMASIEINGQTLITDNSGKISRQYKDGVYDYIVKKDAYISVYGTVTVGTSNQIINVTMIFDIESLRPEENGNIQMLVYGGAVNLTVDSLTSNYEIIWGDGTSNTLASGTGSKSYSHTYSTVGNYQIEVTNSSSISRCFPTATQLVAYWSIGDSTLIKNITFNGCSKLKTFGNVFKNDRDRTSLYGLLYNCSSLTTINLAPLSGMVNVTNLYNLLYNCSSLTTIDLAPLSGMVNVTNLSYLLYNCSSLTTINLAPLSGMVNVTSLDGLLYNCSSLTTINLAPLSEMVNVTNLYGLLRNCSSLTTIDLAPLSGMVNVTNLDGLLRNCSSLTTIDLAPLSNFKKMTNNSYLINSCPKLSHIDVITPVPFFLSYGALDNGNTAPIYVPDNAVNTYKTATNWSAYASRIQPISSKP